MLIHELPGCSLIEFLLLSDTYVRARLPYRNLRVAIGIGNIAFLYIVLGKEALGGRVLTLPETVTGRVP